MKTKSEIMLKINEIKDDFAKKEEIYDNNFGIEKMKIIIEMEKNKNQLEILKWILDEEIDLATQ